MTLTAIHPEDIKAELRKRFGKLGNFEIQRGLKSRSVTDVLRGKPSRPTAEAIATELGMKVHDLFPDKYSSADADCSNADAVAHSLIGEAE